MARVEFWSTGQVNRYLATYPHQTTKTMFQDNTQGAGVPTVPPATDSLPDHQFEIVRHTLFGTLTAVQNTIKLLHKLNYAEPNDWSRPLPTGRVNEVMAILTKRVRVG